MNRNVAIRSISVNTVALFASSASLILSAAEMERSTFLLYRKIQIAFGKSISVALLFLFDGCMYVHRFTPHLI